MEVIFGLSLDGPTHPPVATADAAVMGKAVCGPLGLLQLLEKRTGLGGAWASQPLRIEAYRQRLLGADDSTRFFSRSLHADAHSVAETLLAWRDELYLAGWNFATAAGLSPRLHDLSLVENLPLPAPPVPWGFPERFHALRRALPRRPLLLRRITLAEPRRLFGPHWEQFLAALETCGVVISDWTPPLPQSTGDLGRAQDALLSGKPQAAQADGSLLLFTAESELHAADILAAWLSANPDPERLLLLPPNDRSLERVLTGCGLAALGVHLYSAQRPILQLLPLLCELLWAPLNPYRLIEFLTLPDTPVPRRVARKLAEAVAEAPGIGGAPWQHALAELESGMLAEGTAPATWDAIRAAVASWLEGKRYPLSPGIPTSVLVELANRIAQWAGGHPLRDGEDDSQLKALSAQAGHLATIMETQPEPQITQPQLQRLLRSVQGEGQALGEIAEAGHLPWVTEPEALLAPVPELIWVGFTGRNARGLSRAIWTTAERHCLEQLGVGLPDPGLALERLVAGYRRAVLMATKRLILVIPHREAAEVSGAHPLQDRLVAAFGESLKKLELQDSEWLGGDARICRLNAVPVGRRNLPRPQRFWTVPKTAVPRRETESYSSLVSLFEEPYRWVLNYPAKLKEGPLQAIGNSKALMGTLAHRLFEELFTPGESCATWTEQTITARIDTLIQELLPREGAVFLLPGAGSERRQFQRKALAGALEMARHIRENGWRVVAAEHPATGILADQELSGYVDLLLTRDNGELAVVDLKWTMAKYLRQNFTEHRCYQLALYARMLGGKQLPHVAYFSLDEARLIAPDTQGFRGARVAELPEGESLATLLAGMQTTFRFRRGQLELGAIEVPVPGTLADPALPLPVGCLVNPESSRDPREYLALVGWAEESHA